VWGGMHYPSTASISDAKGEAIATYVDRTNAASKSSSKSHIQLNATLTEQP